MSDSSIDKTVSLLCSKKHHIDEFKKIICCGCSDFDDPRCLSSCDFVEYTAEKLYSYGFRYVFDLDNRVTMGLCGCYTAEAIVKCFCSVLTDNNVAPSVKGKG